MTAPVLADFIKAYDVRGVVPDQLNVDVAFALGSAFAQVVALPEQAEAVVIGHDMRPSSPELSRAFADGVASHGIDAVLIGLCSTDGSTTPAAPRPARRDVHRQPQPGAVQRDQAVPCRRPPVGQDSGLAQIRDLGQAILDGGNGFAREETEPGTVTERDVGDYAAFLRSLVDLSQVRPLKVVVDAGNGMGGHTVPAVLGTAVGLPELPLEIVDLYFELDGTFPNHEANLLEPENLRDLQAAVREHGADIGIAFDGDADRCFVIDERGEPVSPSAITAMVASREIAREREAGTLPRTCASSTTSSPRRPSRRSSRPRARRRCAPAWGTRSSRQRWPARARSSAASTARTTTSATSGSPTPACSPRCTCWPPWSQPSR